VEDQVLSSERMSVFALIGWTDEQLSMSPRCERFSTVGPSTDANDVKVQAWTTRVSMVVKMAVEEQRLACSKLPHNQSGGRRRRVGQALVGFLHW
jgi:ABC-type glutathione transport system ATPase component